MRNVLAFSFVVVFLAACSAYTYTHTSSGRKLPDFSADLGAQQWRDSRGIN